MKKKKNNMNRLLDDCHHGETGDERMRKIREGRRREERGRERKVEEMI